MRCQLDITMDDEEVTAEEMKENVIGSIEIRSEEEDSDVENRGEDGAGVHHKDEEGMVRNSELRSEDEDNGFKKDGDTVVGSNNSDEGQSPEKNVNDSQSKPKIKRPFPKAFYDPNTKTIMLNPMVHPNGTSYEKNEDLNVGYPNRALQDYIEQELDRFGDERPALLQLEQNIRNGWQKLLEKSALPTGEQRPLPGTSTSFHFRTLATRWEPHRCPSLSFFLPSFLQSPFTVPLLMISFTNR